VALKIRTAESSTSPMACGREGGYKTDGIREYYGLWLPISRSMRF
jgi:hypothetical protein